MSAFGTARYATPEEIDQVGLTSATWNGRPAPDGLFLGFTNVQSFKPIKYGGDLHQLIVAGTGGGKFTTALAPMLLDIHLDHNTVVVVDPKGEVARLVGPFFEMPFSTRRVVFLLDPWDVCETGQTSVLNVLAEINPDNPNYVDDARALADAIVIPSGAENTHWDNAARNFLTAVLLYVALHPKEEGRRDLIRVREIVTLTWAMPNAYLGPKRETLSALLFELLDSDLAGGAIKRACSGLLNKEDKERSGIISSIDRDTSWIDSPPMAKVLRGDSLSLKEAALDAKKYFVVLPPDFFGTHRGWLRLVVTSFAKAFRRYQLGDDRPQHERWRHIVIDEFANLGEMSFVMHEISIARGYDVKYTFAIQGLSQLEAIYGKAWHSFINNTFQRFFAVGDLMTAEYVSQRLGASTALSHGRTDGKSHSRGSSFSEGATAGDGYSIPMSGGGGGASQTYSGSQSTSRGTSESSGWSQGHSETQIQRPLMTADEVIRLPSQNQLLFFRGMHPIYNWRPPYWQAVKSWQPPPLTLKQIWLTHEADRVDDVVLKLWKDWIRGAMVQIEPRALPGPAATRVEWPQWFSVGSSVALIMMALLSWFWPNPPHP